MIAQRKKSYESRPQSVRSRTHRVRTQCGNLYITISRKDNKIFEVFAYMGKSGGCMISNMSALTVSVTMGIRHGIDPQIYIDKLKGISCPSKTWENGTQYLSCADAIAQTMETELEYIQFPDTETIDVDNMNTKTLKGNKTHACNSRDTEEENDCPNQLQRWQEL